MINFPDSPTTGDQFTDSNSQIWQWNGELWFRVLAIMGEAPMDATRYGRQDGQWLVDPIQNDAPSDGNQYARKDAGWEQVAGAGSGGKQIYLPAGAWREGEVPADIGVVGPLTNGLLFDTWDFDPIVQEEIISSFVIPDDYLGGDIVANIYWTQGNSNAQTVNWRINANTSSDGNNLASSLDTVDIAATAVASPDFLDITSGGIIATLDTQTVGDLLTMELQLPTTGSLTVDARFIGMLITYN